LFLKIETLCVVIFYRRSKKTILEQEKRLHQGFITNVIIRRAKISRGICLTTRKIRCAEY
jgi:hypothetical protein